jgi:hypothetical protein
MLASPRMLDARQALLVAAAFFTACATGGDDTLDPVGSDSPDSSGGSPSADSGGFNVSDVGSGSHEMSEVGVSDVGSSPFGSGDVGSDVSSVDVTFSDVTPVQDSGDVESSRDGGNESGSDGSATCRTGSSGSSCFKGTCEGCCDTDGNCHPGTSNADCGSLSNCCVDCTAVSMTCQVGVCS